MRKILYQQKSQIKPSYLSTIFRKKSNKKKLNPPLLTRARVRHVDQTAEGHPGDECVIAGVMQCRLAAYARGHEAVEGDTLGPVNSVWGREVFVHLRQAGVGDQGLTGCAGGMEFTYIKISFVCVTSKHSLVNLSGFLLT